jgi:6-pyruvoyl-tetrahydropterin synthase
VKITLFYKNVTVLDYAYLDGHKGVIGGSLKVHVEFLGHTDDEGVVYDFSYAKKKVKEIIDRDCDHRLVVPKGLVRGNDIVKFSYPYGLKDEQITYECPAQGVCELPFAHINKQTICAYLEEQVLKEMPETVDSIRLTLEEETLEAGKSVFHYSHGLKDHYGNCQRLFHGHQNSVDIFVNGAPRRDLEEYLALELFKGNVHFCFWENVANKEEVIKSCGEKLPQGRYEELPQVEIEYTASQGLFKGSLPGRAIYFMQEETTVENLSIHFARLIKGKLRATDIVEVRAYEGVAKGSITTL